MGLLVTPGVKNLVIYQGATFRPTPYVWTSGPDEANQTIVNLTGCTARAMIRENYDTAPALITLTTENGGITLGGTAGTIGLYISDADTAALPRLDKPGRWDLEIVWSDGDVARLLMGSVSISPEVTHD